MKTEFYVAAGPARNWGETTVWWTVFNRMGRPISEAFPTFEQAMSWLNDLTCPHAEHHRCDLCSEGFVTGIADTLCPKCRPKIRSKKS